jgi:hypothetical protein
LCELIVEVWWVVEPVCASTGAANITAEAAARLRIFEKRRVIGKPPMSHP